MSPEQRIHAVIQLILNMLFIFFYICEYFNITPQEFFNFGEEPSNGMDALIDQLKQFDAEQINALTAFIKTIVKK